MVVRSCGRTSNHVATAKASLPVTASDREVMLIVHRSRNAVSERGRASGSQRSGRLERAGQERLTQLL